MIEMQAYTKSNEIRRERKDQKENKKAKLESASGAGALPSLEPDEVLLVDLDALPCEFSA